MALEAGRVGVRNDQVDAYGRVKHEAGTVTADIVEAKRLSIKDDNGSIYIDADPTDKTTSLYGAVEIGSAETPTNLTVNGNITSENLFASDEFEFTDDTGDFGTRAKIKINAAIDTDALANKIMAIMSQRDKKGN